MAFGNIQFKRFFGVSINYYYKESMHNELRGHTCLIWRERNTQIQILNFWSNISLIPARKWCTCVWASCGTLYHLIFVLFFSCFFFTFWSQTIGNLQCTAHIPPKKIWLPLFPSKPENHPNGIHKIKSAKPIYHCPPTPKTSHCYHERSPL